MFLSLANTLSLHQLVKWHLWLLLWGLLLLPSPPRRSPCAISPPSQQCGLLHAGGCTDGAMLCSLTQLFCSSHASRACRRGHRDALQHLRPCSSSLSSRGCPYPWQSKTWGWDRANSGNSRAQQGEVLLLPPLSDASLDRLSSTFLASAPSPSKLKKDACAINAIWLHCTVD